MSQISDSEIEDIMIEIQKMNLNETKEVNRTCRRTKKNKRRTSKNI